MQQLLFGIFFIGSLLMLYLSFKENTQFFALMSMAFNLGLAGGLTVSGIDFLTQVDANGFFIYTAAKVATNPFVAALFGLHLGLGFLSMYWFFRIMEQHGWKISLF